MVAARSITLTRRIMEQPALARRDNQRRFRWVALRLGPAVALHEGSTLVVVFNALRLLAYKDAA